VTFGDIRAASCAIAPATTLDPEQGQRIEEEAKGGKYPDDASFSRAIFDVARERAGPDLYS
jgi:hypothetical protein